MKVLIADDDELVLEVYSQILQAQPDFDVTTACDANDACEVLRSQPAFDLVLLDLGMPGMEGFAGLRRVIELLDDGIVAIMSGREDAVVARDAIAAGAAGFIPKTIGPASLPSAVRSLVTGPSSQAFDVVQAAGGTRDADKPANLTGTRVCDPRLPSPRSGNGRDRAGAVPERDYRETADQDRLPEDGGRRPGPFG